MTTAAETNGKRLEQRRDEVKQAVKSACDGMRIEGVPPHNYVEQLSWLFFLKSFEETEDRLAFDAEFEGKSYQRRLEGDYRWSAWARKGERPDEMLTFVNG